MQLISEIFISAFYRIINSPLCWLPCAETISCSSSNSSSSSNSNSSSNSSSRAGGMSCYPRKETPCCSWGPPNYLKAKIGAPIGDPYGGPLLGALWLTNVFVEKDIHSAESGEMLEVFSGNVDVFCIPVRIQKGQGAPSKQQHTIKRGSSLIIIAAHLRCII